MAENCPSRRGESCYLVKNLLLFCWGDEAVYVVARWWEAREDWRVYCRHGFICKENKEAVDELDSSFKDLQSRETAEHSNRCRLVRRPCSRDLEEKQVEAIPQVTWEKRGGGFSLVAPKRSLMTFIQPPSLIPWKILSSGTHRPCRY